MLYIKYCLGVKVMLFTDDFHNSDPYKVLGWNPGAKPYKDNWITYTSDKDYFH